MIHGHEIAKHYSSEKQKRQNFHSAFSYK